LALESIRRFRLDTLDEWAELWSADCRLDSPEGWPEQGPFVGIEPVKAQFRRILLAWSEFPIEDVEVLADPGDWVVVRCRVPARGLSSGLETQLFLAVAYRIEDGLLKDCAVCWHPDEALAAAGLSV